MVRSSGLMVCVVLGASACALSEVRQHPGGKELPSQAYIRRVSASVSPVERVYIPSKDGVYLAAAIRKPKGNGPFPVLVHFHGAPGGRGMDQLAGWIAGTTGGPVWERFLEEGYAVVVADYRRAKNFRAPIPEDQFNFIDDGMAVLDYVRALPYADPARITLYGVSLGGNLVAEMLSRTQVHAAILGAPAVMWFLGMSWPTGDGSSLDFWKDAKYDAALAERKIAAVKTPVLILAGTADGLKHVDRVLHDLLAKASKPVWFELYENGYHDFCMGPQGQAGRREPLMDATLDALERSVRFSRDPLQYK